MMHIACLRSPSTRQQIVPRSTAPTAKPARSKSPSVHARHLRRLAADQRAAGHRGSHSATPGDHGTAASIDVSSFASGEIVEEEQRLGTLNDEIVDAHRDEVDADRVVPAGVDGDLELGANTVVGSDQDRVLEAGRLEVEQTAKTADVGVGAGPPRGGDERLDRPHQCIASVDVDAGILVSYGRVRALRGHSSVSVENRSS